MERYQVILAYDGSHFKGFQRQAKVRSVQGVVETALRALNWQGTSILAAGRTDAGAHAIGQVVAFDIHWEHGDQDLQHALNKHLPADVVAMEVKQVRASFHPRYDASWRTYLYRIYSSRVRQPLFEPYAWRVWPEFDQDLLHGSAQLLVGTHDFVAFGTPPQSGGNTIRRVLKSEWRLEAPFFVFEIRAHAFLYHMVRRLVFMQVSIAQGKLVLNDLMNALNTGTINPEAGDAERTYTNRLVHGLAPARGLILAEVHYPSKTVQLGEDVEIYE